MRPSSGVLEHERRAGNVENRETSHLDRVLYNLTNWLIKFYNMARLFHHRPGLPRRMGSRGQPEESRAAILQAAAHEFAEHGIAGARTDAIAREARVNKALLYYYFKDKETLYGAVLDDAFSGLKTTVFASARWRLAAARKDAGLCGGVFRFRRFEPDVSTADAAGDDAGARRPVGAHRQDHQELYSADFRAGGRTDAKGIADGEFRPVNPAHFVPSMVAMIVFYFSSAPMMQKIVGFNPLTPERIAERRAAVLDFISAALFPAQSQDRLRKEHAHERAQPFFHPARNHLCDRRVLLLFLRRTTRGIWY